ncbi:MAG: hypothetical protein WBN96_09365, partial [Gammaproteobacteria bacterium]
MKIESTIDAALIDQAEEEAFQILLAQRLSYNERWHARFASMRLMSVLRILGLLLCMLGLVLSVIAVFCSAGVCQAGFKSGIYILVFILAGLVFYFLPSLDSIIKSRVKNMSVNGSRKLASRCVKAARKAVPFRAEYDIKGDLVTYYRGKDDNWKLAWSRKLKGVAVHGKSVTVFFRKWTSIQPIMILLHEDFTAIKSVLTEHTIEFRSIDSD